MCQLRQPRRQGGRTHCSDDRADCSTVLAAMSAIGQARSAMAQNIHASGRSQACAGPYGRHIKNTQPLCLGISCTNSSASSTYVLPQHISTCRIITCSDCTVLLLCSWWRHTTATRLMPLMYLGLEPAPHPTAVLESTPWPGMLSLALTLSQRKLRLQLFPVHKHNQELPGKLASCEQHRQFHVSSTGRLLSVSCVRYHDSRSLPSCCMASTTCSPCQQQPRETNDECSSVQFSCSKAAA